MALPNVLAQRIETIVSALTAVPRTSGAALVNDVHSQLNATRVHRVIEVRTLEDVRLALRLARDEDRPVCIAGGWHAMGGQQFAEAGVLLDTRHFNRVLGFDRERGTIEVEAGMQWPELLAQLDDLQRGIPTAPYPRWAIAQKQTGADRLSIGGALSANVHGRGLAMRPFVGDVESFTIIGADGQTRQCSRDENAELFRLAIGGYGLFGFVAAVTLRLVPRRRLRRVVEVITADRLDGAFADRIARGFLYGDFQFAIDPASRDFLHRGIFSAYEPVDDESPIPADQRALTPEQWRGLLLLAHVDKSRAFDVYASHYLATSGQHYWSDEHQLSTYLDDYHAAVDAHLAERGHESTGTEMITELYVPRERLTNLLAASADDFRRNAVEVIYGTIRLIERDEETFLPWARDRYACVIFNLHVPHTESGLAHSAAAFRRLIDIAIALDGSYYLTYHRHARADQVLACYPRFVEMLRKKREYDPEERFQSEWYRWYRRMFDP